MEASIVYRQAVPEDREVFRDALEKFFYAEEPVTINYHEGGEVTPDDMECSLALIEEGFVMLAVDETSGEVVGVAGGALIEPDEVEKMIALAGQTETRKFSDILRLLAHLMEKANVFDRYGVSKAYHVNCMGIDPRFRGTSVSKTLVEKHFEHALSCGVTVISTVATGIYSARLCQRFGMECVHCMAYSDFRNELGQQVFLGREPHLEIRTMVRILENEMDLQTRL